MKANYTKYATSRRYHFVDTLGEKHMGFTDSRGSRERDCNLLNRLSRDATTSIPQYTNLRIPTWPPISNVVTASLLALARPHQRTVHRFLVFSV